MLHTLQMLERHFPCVKVLLARKREKGWCSVRVLASYQCGWRSIPARCRMYVEFDVGSRLNPGVFIRVLRFPSSTKTNTLNSNSTRIEDPRGLFCFFYIVMEFKLFIHLCCGHNAKICSKIRRSRRVIMTPVVIGHVRYCNVVPRLSGQNCKFLKFLLSFNSDVSGFPSV